MDEQQRIDKYLSYVPSTAQKRVQRENFNIFFHYGLNTFTDKEWGNGKADPKLFDPSEQDTDQWIRTAKEAGAYGVILTCKHHDGFCLWQTNTTDYSIKASPYKGGKGDVVREVSDSCRKYGIKFGVYLSPWDRNNEYYSTPKYNDIYCEQIRELLTNYGKVWCIWLDAFHAALGEDSQIYSTDENPESFGLFDKNVDEERDEKLRYLMWLRKLKEDDPDLIKRINKMPLRARVGRKSKLIPMSTITFIRNKRRDASQPSPSGSQPAVGIIFHCQSSVAWCLEM